MKIVTTRRTDYGIRAAVFLAGLAPDRVTAGTIATEMDIPQGFLHQVLQALHRGGLVSSVSGRHGGYALVRDPEEISVLEIVESLEGSLDTGECALRGGPCHWQDVCAVHEVWSAGRAALAASLASSTLADVSRTDKQLEAGSYQVPADSHRAPCRSPAELP
jgi:Rrf2 family protein